MFAVIETGGKQYVVTPDKKLKIEKITLDDPATGSGQEKKGVVFDKVLLYSDGKETKIGKPYLKNVKVEAEVVNEGKKDKIIIFKYKPKKRYKKKRGHRQPYTEVLIKSIESNK